MKGENRSSYFSLIFSMVIMGTIGIFRRYIPISSGLLAFSRGILGSAFIVVFLIIKGRKLFKGLSKRNLFWLAVTGAAIGINWMLLFEAFNYTTVAIATLCYYMQPTIVMVLSYFIFNEVMGLKKIICAIVAVIGMVLVSGITQAGGGQGGNFKGVIYALGASLFYASVVILNKKIKNVDIYEKTAVQLFSAALIMIPYLALSQGFSGIVLDGEVMGLILLVGIVHTGIAYVFYFGSMPGLKAQTIAVFSYIDPIVALLASAIFLKEALSPAGIIGAILILGAAFISEVDFKNKAS